MKLIILDHLRRWWMIWVIALVSNCLIVVGIAMGHNLVCPVGMFMGAMLLSFDMQRGHTRSIVSLPVTARQIGRAWWWATLGLPVLVMTMITFLMYAGFSCWRHDWSGLSGYVVSCVSNFLTLAAMFYALTGMPRAGTSYNNWKSQARAYFFGIMWGLSFASWLLFQNVALAPLSILGLFLAGVCLTIMGWFNAERLVRERSLVLAGSPAPRAKSTTPSRAAEGYGGLAFMAQSISVRMVYMGVAMFAVFAIVLPLINTFSMGSAKVDLMGDTFPIFAFQFLYIMTFQIATFTMHVRHLRTMPVSATKLAGVLVFTTLVTMLLTFYGAMVLLSAVFQSPLPGPEKIIQQGALLQIAVATSVVPLFVWRPMEVLTFVIMILMMGGGMFAIFFKQSLPPIVTVSASVVIVLAVFMATKVLIERNSRAYRLRTAQFGTWNWGGGR